MEERKDEGSARSDNGDIIEEGLKQRETRTRISDHVSELNNFQREIRSKRLVRLVFMFRW